MPFWGLFVHIYIYILCTVSFNDCWWIKSRQPIYNTDPRKDCPQSRATFSQAYFSDWGSSSATTDYGYSLWEQFCHVINESLRKQWCCWQQKGFIALDPSHPIYPRITIEWVLRFLSSKSYCSPLKWIFLVHVYISTTISPNLCTLKPDLSSIVNAVLQNCHNPFTIHTKHFSALNINTI